MFRKSEWWWFKCKGVQHKNLTTENMLRQCRKQLNMEKKKSWKADCAGRDLHRKDLVIKSMEKEIQDLKDDAKLIKESSTETIVPDQLHILRFELNKAESTVQKLTEATQNLKEEMSTKDQIIAAQGSQIDEMIVVQRRMV